METPQVPRPETEPQLSRTDALVLAYHGLRERLAIGRMERAGSKMAEMDHKAALYSDLHNEIAGNNVGQAETVDQRPAEIESVAENIGAVLARGRHSAKEAERKRVHKVYGGESTRPESMMPIRRQIHRRQKRQESQNAIDAYQSELQRLHPELLPQPGDSKSMADHKKRQRARLHYQARVNAQAGNTATPPTTRKQPELKTLEQKRVSKRGVTHPEKRARAATKKRNRSISKIQSSYESIQAQREKAEELIRNS